MHNLLTEQLIRVRNRQGATLKSSLPGILSGLAANEIECFPGLAPHQEHAWHAFLVQLAAIALQRSGKSAPPAKPEEWIELLRNLTPEFPDDEPWSLVVEDLSLPAFMQPPVPEKNLDKWKIISTPETIDILVTAKNHDVKASRFLQPRSEHWIFALINLQTMSGFPGAKNYGVIRMNSGYGNRPCVAFSRGAYPGDRFTWDLNRLLAGRDSLIQDCSWCAAENGRTLLWLEPWDGMDSLPLEGLDPYFIEICRRVRFLEDNGKIVAKRTGTVSQRVAGQVLKGNTGDPWTPIRIKDAAGLSVGSRGFHYGLVQELLFSANYKPGLCQEIPDSESGALEFIAQAITRGQGKTEGFHQRRIPLTAKVRSMLPLSKEKSRLGAISEKMVEKAGDARRLVLKPAILCLLQGAPEKLNYQDGRADGCLAEFDQLVDTAFFPDLWAAVEIEDADERKRLWARRLANFGRDILSHAEQSLPVPEGRRYRALAAAERIFEGGLRNKFPELKKGGGAI